MKQFTYRGDGKRLSRALLEFAPEIGYNAFCKLLRNKDIRVNGVKQNQDITLSDGDKVVVYNKIPSFIEAFCNADILIIVKPKGISSEGKGSADEIVKAKYPNAVLCHRLDTNTDGLLIFALNENAYNELYKAFAEHTIEKYYKALVYGKMMGEGILKAYLVKDSKAGKVKVSDKDIAGAEQIITKYRVLENMPDRTLLEVSPVTGKTHQIRAHLAFNGHFVLGDGKYGRDDINRRLGYKKQQLTAYKIVFNFEKSSPLYYLNGKKFEL